MAYGCTAVAGIEAIILYVTIEQLINSIDCSLQNDNELGICLSSAINMT